MSQFNQSTPKEQNYEDQRQTKQTRHHVDLHDCSNHSFAACSSEDENDHSIPQEITTLGSVNNCLGTLKFFDGTPDKATVAKVYDNLDFQRGVQAFLTGIPWASQVAMRQGMRSFGPDNQTVVLFETLMYVFKSLIYLLALTLLPPQLEYIHWRK